VTLKVTTPSNALAGYQAKIKVIASLANIERTLNVETKTKIAKIYGLELSANHRNNVSGSVYPGKSINFTFQVINLGNAKESIKLNLVSELEASYYWNSVFNVSTVPVPAYSSKDINLRVDIPSKTVAITYAFDITGSMVGYSLKKQLDLEIDVFRVFGVNLLCSNPTISTDPGVNGSYSLALSNEGNYLQSFLLTIPNLPSGWTVQFRTGAYINDTLEVEPFTQINVNAVVHPALGTLVGEYNLTAKVQCVGIDFVVCAYTDLIMEINRVYGIELTTPTVTVETDPGEGTLLYLYLKNLGNDQDFGSIHVLSQPEEWDLILDAQYNILLPANGQRTIGLRVTPYVQEIVGTYNINLRGILAGDEDSVSDLQVKVTINRIYGLNVTSKDPTINVRAGMTTVVPIIITNDGNEKDSVNLSIPYQIQDCSVEINNGNMMKLKPFGSKEINLAIDADECIVAGVKTIPIQATLESSGEVYNFNLKFKINQYYGVKLSADEIRISTQPGREISYEIMIHNTGNGEDTYTVMVEGIPINWKINFPTKHSITVKPFRAINKTLYLNIPADEPYHKVDMEIRVLSTGDNRTNARLPFSASIEEEEMNVLGVDLQSLSLIIGIIVVIILVIAFVLIRSRKKRGYDTVGAIHYESRDTNHLITSDGSRVKWEEPTQPLPAQYNPPTPIVPQTQQLVVQVERPKTYRYRSNVRSQTQSQYYPPGSTYDTYDSNEQIPHTPNYPLQPEDRGLQFNAPSTYGTYDETQALDQLDAELTAEAQAEATAEAQVASGPRSRFDDRVVEVGSVPEFHESDEFSLKFKRPDRESVQRY
jgi:uncharacterized membrane protein